MKFGYTRKQNQRIHAKRRFMERFEIDFTKKIRREIISRINKKELLLLEKQGSRYWVYYCNIKSHDVAILYDRLKRNIVTCLFFDRYIDNLYEKMGKGMAVRIRKEIKELTGHEFSPEQNIALSQIISKELKKVRELAKKETNIIKD